MNRLLLVCLSAIVCFLVCCTDKDKIPAGVLNQDKMEKVLWDMIQAERFRETFIRDSSKDLKAETFKLYAQVFEIHKISKDEFVKSYKFYMSRPDIARGMFDSLATKASRRRDELYKPKPVDSTKVQRPADSAKVQQPATTAPVDSAKKVTPQPAPASPHLPPPIRPNKRFMRDRVEFDSLRQLKLRQ
jgi:hypothetical protein